MLTGSVGERGANRSQDVKLVQSLLNKQIATLSPLRPLAVDGLVGPKTIEAIKEFQRRVVNLTRPDGRIDPNGKTLAALQPSPRLQQNLAFAKRAIVYVKQKVRIGASNKLSDIISSKGESLGCVVGSRIGQQLIDIGFSKPDWAKGKLNIEVVAIGTEKSQCGNCGEQAAVAWVYLWKQLHVRPIDYMNWSNGLRILDHAFVVIGRKAGSASDVASWGPDAVVCDPWDSKAYPAVEIESHMKGKRFNSMLRV